MAARYYRLAVIPIPVQVTHRSVDQLPPLQLDLRQEYLSGRRGVVKICDDALIKQQKLK